MHLASRHRTFRSVAWSCPDAFGTSNSPVYHAESTLLGPTTSPKDAPSWRNGLVRPDARTVRPRGVRPGAAGPRDCALARTLYRPPAPANGLGWFGLQSSLSAVWGGDVCDAACVDGDGVGGLGRAEWRPAVPGLRSFATSTRRAPRPAFPSLLSIHPLPPVFPAKLPSPLSHPAHSSKMVHFKSLALTALAFASAASAAPHYAGAGLLAGAGAEVEAEAAAGVGAEVWKRTFVGAGAGVGAAVGAEADADLYAGAGALAGVGAAADVDVEGEAGAELWKRGGSKGKKDCKAAAKTAYSSASTKISSCTKQIKTIVSGSLSASAKVSACEKVIATAKASITGLQGTIAGLEGYADVGGSVSAVSNRHLLAVCAAKLTYLSALADRGWPRRHRVRYRCQQPLRRS